MTWSKQILISVIRYQQNTTLRIWKTSKKKIKAFFTNDLPNHACQIKVQSFAYDSDCLTTSAARKYSIFDQKSYFTLVPYQFKAAAFIDNNVNFVIYFQVVQELILICVYVCLLDGRWYTSILIWVGGFYGIM